jgi:hypothetical protein
MAKIKFRDIRLGRANRDKIEALKEDDFDKFFTELTTVFHFWDDWKADFKGSEFLIPTVEKEMETRKRFLNMQFFNKLSGMKEGFYTLDGLIEEYKKLITKNKP